MSQKMFDVTEPNLIIDHNHGGPTHQMTPQYRFRLPKGVNKNTLSDENV
jgi:hypothetical protein